MDDSSIDMLEGSDRFEIVRRIGSGGMGVVYETLDRQLGRAVALKTLRRCSPSQLYLFKNEFRSLADITHPNLVGLHELLLVGDRWLFTMDLVQGRSLLDHVRHRTGPADGDSLLADTISQESSTGPLEMISSRPLVIGPTTAMPLTEHGPAAVARLRNVLSQMVRGVSALHDAGKLHRDLKPSNVLVDDDGHVTVLDFGLITELGGSAHSDPLKKATMVGTLPYMSPEQASGQELTAASDWYSLGVMLYEALAGRLPFSGTVAQILEAKKRSSFGVPVELAGQLPRDLVSLCEALLQPRPEARLSAEEIFEVLEGVQQTRPLRDTPTPRLDAAGLVGRVEQLETLQQALEETGRARSVLVTVSGRSGMGKTALVKALLAHARRQNVVVLRGRCYEQESVPYKALDTVIDALTGHLMRLADHEARALMPRHIRALARVFPVLKQVEAVASARRRGQEIPDQRELRRRAVGALRELLGRLADQVPVIIWIDDLQWGDMDSGVVISEILRPPDPPPLLLLTSFRSEDAQRVELIKAFLSPDTEEPRRDIELGPLSQDESRALALQRLSVLGNEDEALAEAIARESEGIPFFIDELALGAAPMEATGDLEGCSSLDAAILRRVERLTPSCRRLLEMAAVAGQPTGRAMVAAAARLEQGWRRDLKVLRNDHLIRTTGTRDEDPVECYHDRIRETVVQSVPAPQLEQHHEALAEQLLQAESSDPERLAHHLLQGGQPAKAATSYWTAARNAEQMLAFDHAAKLYRLTLELMPTGDGERAGLQASLGDALANAGRGEEAARALLEASRHERGAGARLLEQRAAEQYLRGGHVAAGMKLVGKILASLDLKLLNSPVLALASLLWRRMLLFFRKRLGFRRRAEADIPTERLAHIDGTWSVCLCLGMIDPLRAGDFQTRNLLLALREGEPYRICRALTAEAAFVSVAGQRVRARVLGLLGEAGALSEEVKHPHATGLVHLARTIAAFQVGAWRECLEGSERAEEIFTSQCNGVAWEVGTSHIYQQAATMGLGDLRTLMRRLPHLLDDALDRDDRHAYVHLQLGLFFPYKLIANDVEGARRDVEQSIELWTTGKVDLQRLYALLMRAQIDLYDGDGEGGFEQIHEAWRAYRWLLVSIQSQRIKALDQRARGALAAAQQGRSERLGQALKDGRRLAGEGLGWATGLWSLIQGQAARLEGHTPSALEHLGRAADTFEQQEMALLAAVTRYRLGQYRQDAGGVEEMAAAEAFMRDQGIARPERVAAMLAPVEP